MATTCVFKIEKKLKQTIPLVSFANGKLNDSADQRIIFDCYQNNTTGSGLQRKRAHKIMVAHSDRLHYSGPNFGIDAPKYEGLCKYHVGLLNKRTGKMKVFPSELFHMKMILNDNTIKNNDSLQDVSYVEKMDLLTSAFGSKKKKQSMDARQKYLVKEEGLKTSVLEAVVVGKAIAEKSPRIPTISNFRSESLPPQNALANNVEEVYDFKDIISDTEYESIGSLAETLLNASRSDLMQWKESEDHPIYIINSIAGMAQLDQNRAHKCKVLAYIECLLSLLKLKYSDFKMKDPLPTIPNPLKNLILDKFTVKGERGLRSLPQRLKDKIMAYILVLLLLIQNYTVNLSDLQVVLKVAITRIVIIANSLGCYVDSKKGGIEGDHTKIATLKLPLFEKKEFKGKGKGKR